MNNFHPIVANSIQIAQSYAIKNNHPELTKIHLLYGFIKNPQSFLSKSKSVKREFKKLKKILESLPKVKGNSDIRPDNQLNNWITLASGDAAQEGKEVLEKHFIKFLGKFFPNINLEELNEIDENSEVPTFLINLNELAENNKLDPVIGRTEEIRAVMEILGRRGKNNPVLVGAAGVGKTAIVEGLALQIVKDDVIDFLKDKTVYSLDMGQLMAGTKFQGEFEERLTNLIKFLKNQNGQAVLFIDEMHQLVGAGQTQGAMDAANLLKPSLARGEFLVIGATTPEEYQKYILNDSALDRRFRNVTVNEPSKEDTIEILTGLKEKFEIHHGVKITDEALYSSVFLADQYITNKNFPDKSIDLIDEACSSLKLSTESLPPELVKLKIELRNKKIKQQVEPNNKDINGEILSLEEEIKKETDTWEGKIHGLKEVSSLRNELDQLNMKLDKANREQNYEEASRLKYASIPEIEQKLESIDTHNSEKLTKEHIASVVSRQTGIPVEKILKSEQDHILKLEEYLNSKVFGQEDSLHELSETLITSYAGIKDQTKPLGSFLLKGPSGVGKTETAKALAKYLFDDESRIIRLDMSEFSEKHSVSKLIGAPAGYVGYDEGGVLTEAIRKQPYSVILFDEIEKAHPDFSDILLQVLDDGRLTDNRGRTMNFNNTIILLTTNSKNIEEDFKPEVIGRLDSILEYNTLGDKVLDSLINKQLSILNENLKDKNIQLSLGNDILKELKKRGYDKQYGARPLANVFNKIVMRPLSKSLLKNEIGEGIFELNKNGIIKKDQ